MRSFVLLWLCASGCDLVFLREQTISELCGPYAAPTPVPFAAGVPALTHFSVVGDRALGRETESPFRLRALRLAGGTWEIDAEREINLDALRQNGVHFAHLAYDTTLFAAQQVDGLYRIYEYGFLAGGWAVMNKNLPVAFETSIDVLPGGALITGAGGADEYRYLATARGTGDVAIVVEAPNVDGWRTEVTSGVLTTQAINEEHAVSAAALALGRTRRPTLIYAATPRGSATGSDLYVSQRVSGLFQIGLPLALGGDDGEEREPSTNPDCTVLYFRRGDQILQARAR